MKVQSSENKLVITEEFIFDPNKLPSDPNNHFNLYTTSIFFVLKMLSAFPISCIYKTCFMFIWTDSNLFFCGCIKYKQILPLQSNFGRSNSPVLNTRDHSNSFVGLGNLPIHLMLKYTPGSNSDGSNSKHGPQGDFSCKNAMMARTKYFFTWISHTLDLSSLLFS